MSYLYLLAFIFIYVPLVGYITYVLANNNIDPYAIIPIFLNLLGMFAVICIISYELKLYAQNNITQIVNSISSLLEKEEKFLTLFIGRAASFNLPPWITSDISTYCYFIFTTDRLLIITLSPKIVGIDQLDHYHISNTFDEVINSTYSCSLEDSSKVRLGGPILQPVFTFTHTKATIIPIGESEPYTWAIANKHTRNGELFKKIIGRLGKDGS